MVQIVTNGDVIGDYSVPINLRKISNEELKKLLLAHEHWLHGDRDRNNRTDLSGLDLSGLNLSQAKLSHSYLKYSDLSKAILTGADLSHADISHVNFEGACLAGANLTEAYAVNAKMTDARFYSCEYVIRGNTNVTYAGEATLKRAKMNGVIFSGADLHQADLSEAKLENAKLIGTRLVGANLSDALVQNADFTDANLLTTNLVNADFQGSSLHCAKIKMANLDNANLRNCRGRYFLDDTSIRGTRFATRAADLYSILRRKYTGPMFFLMLLLTMLAFLPYVLKALAWSYVGIIESKSDAYFNEKITRLEKQLSSDAVATIHAFLKPINIARRDDFAATNVLAIVVGWEEKNRPIAVFMTAMLLLYNLFRGVLTFQMSGLRDAEERSQHSPERNEYERLFYIHLYFLRWFMVVAVLIASWNIIKLLSTVVYIPVS